MGFEEFTRQKLSNMAREYFTNLLGQEGLTLRELQLALNDAGAQEYLAEIKVGELLNAPRKPSPKPQQEGSLTYRCIQALKSLDEWVTAEELAMLVDSSPTYVTKILKEAAESESGQNFPVMMISKQIHDRGRPTPHFRYIHRDR